MIGSISGDAKSPQLFHIMKMVDIVLFSIFSLHVIYIQLAWYNFDVNNGVISLHNIPKHWRVHSNAKK